MPRFTDFGSRRNNRGFTNFSMRFLRVYIWLGARYNIGTLSSPAGLAAGQALEWRQLVGNVLKILFIGHEGYPGAVDAGGVIAVRGEALNHRRFLLSELSLLLSTRALLFVKHFLLTLLFYRIW